MPTARKVQDQKEILEKCVENYVKNVGKDSKNPEVKSFYEKLSKNDPEWKKCTENLQVLDDFWNHVADSQPGFVLDYLKNQSKSV